MPSSRPNISKSVGRAFAVLELFGQQRKPLTAARLRESLNIPQPSLRALLGNLVGLATWASILAAGTTFQPPG